MKIHYSSSGKSNYVYQIDPKDEKLIVYKNANAMNNAKTSKLIPIADIKQIVYGITSENIKKKYKNIVKTKQKQPWLFLSLILPKRSIDLYFEDEENLKCWFYGMNYFKKSYAISTEIMTVSGFLLKKLKLKLISKLKDIAETDEKDPNKSILVLIQLKNYAMNNNYGFYNLSFLKIFLLYKKIMKSRQSIELQ